MKPATPVQMGVGVFLLSLPTQALLLTYLRYGFLPDHFDDGEFVLSAYATYDAFRAWDSPWYQAYFTRDFRPTFFHLYGVPFLWASGGHVVAMTAAAMASLYATITALFFVAARRTLEWWPAVAVSLFFLFQPVLFTTSRAFLSEPMAIAAFLGVLCLAGGPSSRWRDAAVGALAGLVLLTRPVEGALLLGLHWAAGGFVRPRVASVLTGAALVAAWYFPYRDAVMDWAQGAYGDYPVGERAPWVVQFGALWKKMIGWPTYLWFVAMGVTAWRAGWATRRALAVAVLVLVLPLALAATADNTSSVLALRRYLLFYALFFLLSLRAMAGTGGRLPRASWLALALALPFLLREPYLAIKEPSLSQRTVQAWAEQCDRALDFLVERGLRPGRVRLGYHFPSHLICEMRARERGIPYTFRQHGQFINEGSLYTAPGGTEAFVLELGDPPASPEFSLSVDFR